MWADTTHLVPVVYRNTLLIKKTFDEAVEVLVNGQCCKASVSEDTIGVYFLDRFDSAVCSIDVRSADTHAPIAGSPLSFRRGGWEGSVERAAGRFVHGFACDNLNPDHDVTVVAYSDVGVMAFAVAKASEAGVFLLVLPEPIDDSSKDMAVRIGIVGSDYCLKGGIIALKSRRKPHAGLMTRLATRPIRVAIKISTPNIRVAHEWGDFHFASSLKASFDRLGIAASVDTNDVWYEPSREADVVIVLRGRHRVVVDPGKLNLMWLISHPDRVEANEYEDYDHIFVASNIYAKTLKEQGVASVNVLHQATDHHLFHPFENRRREPDCLFVGNSRREYRRMVHWCIEKKIALSLYGGGWTDVVSPDLIKAENIPNSDLAQHYAGHLVLLNDHWDTMRDQGFLSNRLFDGSAVGTPIITDQVRGLSEIFGDTICAVNSAEELQAAVTNCIANPVPFLAKAAQARELVLQAHTFDHRAEELRSYIESSSKFRLRFV